MRLRYGFTLIELLVVITVIGILALVIASGLGASRRNAMKTKSMANMREIGAAINFYVGDHNGDFPKSSHTEESESWIYSLASYLQHIDETRVCPADPRAKERLATKTSSYTLNEYICVPSVDRFGRVKEDFTNIFRLPNPSRTISVFIGADGLDLGVSVDHTHSRNWRLWPMVLTDIQPDRFRGGKPNSDRTDGESHYLYADGHVETRPAKWLQKEILAKRNPAIPPQ
jgi:prepilin-type N-terminal cleavage/methylation domain-containing protein/prepilin-type processing-associated H-X9-DG protein